MKLNFLMWKFYTFKMKEEEDVKKKPKLNLNFVLLCITNDDQLFYLFFMFSNVFQ
jgi:hypothetical protein